MTQSGDRQKRMDELMKWCKGDLVLRVLELEKQMDAINKVAEAVDALMTARKEQE